MRSTNEPMQVQKGQIEHIEQKYSLLVKNHPHLERTTRQTNARTGH
jgi:hypothetical protein